MAVTSSDIQLETICITAKAYKLIRYFDCFNIKHTTKRLAVYRAETVFFRYIVNNFRNFVAVLRVFIYRFVKRTKYARYCIISRACGANGQSVNTVLVKNTA